MVQYCFFNNKQLPNYYFLKFFYYPYPSVSCFHGGKLLLDISGELMTLSSGPREDFGSGVVGQGAPSCWEVLCCPRGLAPAWGILDPCSSQFKVFLLIILFANRGLVGRMQLGAGARARWLGGGSPTPGEGTESKMQILVGERGKTCRKPFSWECFASLCPL